MARAKHVHKYHKVTLQFAQVWACGLPDCNHYMPHNLTPLVVGRKSICWHCNTEFVLDDENMKNDKPICMKCDGSSKPISDFLEQMGVK